MNVSIIKSPEFRSWLYGVTMAALAVAGTYGILNGDEIAAWSILGSAVLGVARANTPTGEPPRHALDSDGDGEADLA